MLRHYGCDQAQGFLLGRPGPDFVADTIGVTPEVAAASAWFEGRDAPLVAAQHAERHRPQRRTVPPGHCV
jgi:EAL domain-containing protein (putative c-di-GMP-specific phosphodiesterase class I)